MVVIVGGGAYGGVASTIVDDPYPQAPEIMLEPDGSLRLVRRRQALEQVWTNEA